MRRLWLLLLAAVARGGCLFAGAPPLAGFISGGGGAIPAFALHLGRSYTESIVTNPLETKTATAALLSMTSDVLVQRWGCPANRRLPFTLDKRRAASFALFNAAYKGAFLHFSLPAIFALCKGDALKAVTRGLHVGCSDGLLQALERTLVNQLIVVPIVFFPLFFGVTGAVQGSSLRESIERMRENYLPLLRRSMQFWIPVQLGMFLWLPLKWQVSSVQIVSFVWNMILSRLAGKACCDDTCVLPALHPHDTRFGDDAHGVLLPPLEEEHVRHAEEELESAEVM